MEERTIKEEKKLEREIGTLVNEDRIINFSDAVFAFAATLLVIKIDLPDLSLVHSQTQMFSALFALWPQYFANIVSFLIIGFYWLNHHTIFSLIKKFSLPLVWLNIVFLIFISFLPFPVDLYGDYLTVPFAIAFYSASLALVGYLLLGIWWYAGKYNLIISSVDKKQIKYYLAKNLVAPIIFTLAIPLVWVHPVLAQMSWGFVILGIILVNAHLKPVP